MTSVNALCWSRCTRRLQFRKRRRLRRSRTGTVLRPNWGLLGWWRPPRYVESGAAGSLAHIRRCSSDRFQGSQREGSAGTHPPACAHACRYAVNHRRGFRPPTSASPVRTASGPTIGHSTRPANPRSSCDPPPAHATSAPRRCCPLGSRDARRTTSGRAQCSRRLDSVLHRAGCRCGSATSTSQRRWKAATASRKLGPVARRLRCLHAPPAGGYSDV